MHWEPSLRVACSVCVCVCVCVCVRVHVRVYTVGECALLLRSMRCSEYGFPVIRSAGAHDPMDPWRMPRDQALGRVRAADHPAMPRTAVQVMQLCHALACSATVTDTQTRDVSTTLSRYKSETE